MTGSELFDMESDLTITFSNWLKRFFDKFNDGDENQLKFIACYSNTPVPTVGVLPSQPKLK